MEIKEKIRNKYLKIRNKMPVEENLELSYIIKEKLRNYPPYVKSDNIYIFISMGMEVNTEEIINMAFEQGKNVWSPKIVGAEMEFYRLEHLDKVSKGCLGIREPVSLEKATYDEGLIIVPFIAADNTLNRIGYGKGYYDRFIWESGLESVGIGFDFQIVEDVMANEYDIPVDYIITDRREIGK